MLAYDFPLWRPPSEGDNLIIQATLGCGFNGCTFCSMYKLKGYVERPLEAVFADIEQAARVWPHATRVFLADGDAYGLPTRTLLAICARLRACFPGLTRVSAYATPFNLLKKSVEEIGELKALLVLRFFQEEIAPCVYNQAIGHARDYLQERVADLENVCFAEEFGHWNKGKGRSVARKPR